MKPFIHITKNLSILVLTLMMAANCANAQMPTDSIVADFNEFVRLLEETHPDPYTNYGGRPFFRKAAMEVRFGLAQDSVTDPAELAKRINELLIPLHDGHTGIQNSPFGFGDDDTGSKAAPIRFWPISNGNVVISEIMTEYKDLIGSRLLAIENVPFKKICDDLAQYVSAENESGRITNFCFISSLSFGLLKKSIPNMREDSITFSLLTPEGKQLDLTLPLIDDSFFGSDDTQFSSVEKTDPFPEQQNLSYLFADNKKNTMYFRSSNIVAREALEYMRDNGMEGNLPLDRIYRTYNDGEMPENVDEALAKIPSFSDEFDKMLLEMKKNKSKNLIIDLRGNGGGFTPITIPTLYQMWGDKYIKDATTFGTNFYTLCSPLYLKKMNISMDDLKAMTGESNIMLGDYMWSSEDEEAPQEITDDVRNAFIANCMSSVKDKLTAQHGKPVYTPEHVYVLVNSTTFSAAFHYMFYLWKMGATVVGVPSKQAPNTYMEVTPFELPRTKIEGSISNSLQLFLPVDDARANQFTPDLMPTYEDYMRYNFDTNTELLYLLDYINGNH